MIDIYVYPIVLELQFARISIEINYLVEFLINRRQQQSPEYRSWVDTMYTLQRVFPL